MDNYPGTQSSTITPSTYDFPSTPSPSPKYSFPEVPNSESEEPKINLQKQKEETATPLQQDSAVILPVDSPNFCPSCGRANSGTAYCPQCGMKL